MRGKWGKGVGEGWARWWRFHRGLIEVGADCPQQPIAHAAAPHPNPPPAQPSPAPPLLCVVGGALNLLLLYHHHRARRAGAALGDGAGGRGTACGVRGGGGLAPAPPGPGPPRPRPAAARRLARAAGRRHPLGSPLSPRHAQVNGSLQQKPKANGPCAPRKPLHPGWGARRACHLPQLHAGRVRQLCRVPN